MSILTENTVDITIQRQTVTKTGAGGASRTYTTAARGSLPTLLPARVMQPTADEREAYGIKDVMIGYILIFTTNPQVDNRDRCIFGSSQILEVLSQVNPQQMNRMWIVACFESDRGVK